MNIRQLRSLGFSNREIERRAELGRLHRVHRGVYAVGHSLTSPGKRANLARGLRTLLTNPVVSG